MAFYVVQFLTGLASAASLFLVASGLSIIFGVTRIVNFAHGAFYMLGAYIAFTLTERFSGAFGFWGGDRRGRARRGADRRARRDGAAAAHLSRARTVPAARDLRPDPDGRGSRGADLGARRSRRPPRAGLQGRGRFLRPEHPELRSVPDRARPGRARHSLAAVPAHALGRAGARGDAGPRHGRSARRQPEMAVHLRVRGRRLPRRARRRAADPARCRASRDGSAHHRRGLRRRGDRRPRQHRRRLRRGGAGVRAQRLRHPDLSEDLDHPGLPGDGGGADRAALGPVRQAGGGRAQDAGPHRQSLAAADVERAAGGARRAASSRRCCRCSPAITR